MKHFSFLLPLFFISIGWSQVNMINYTTYPSLQTQSGMNSVQETTEFVLPTSDGGYLLVGHYLKAVNDLDGIVIKVDNLGNELWRDTKGGSGNDYLRSAIELNGNYYIIGSKENNNENAQMWGLKYPVNGTNSPLEHLYDPIDGRSFAGTTLAPAFNGNILVGGSIISNTANENLPQTEGFLLEISTNTLAPIVDSPPILGIGMIVLKIKPTINQSYWVFGEAYNASNENCIDNGPITYIETDTTGFTSGYYSDIFAKRFNSSLFITADQTIGGQSSESYIDAIVSIDGSFFILGYTDCEANTGDSGPDNICLQSGSFQPYWIYKATTEGNLDWSKNTPHSIFNRPFGLLSSCHINEVIYGEIYSNLSWAINFYKISPTINIAESIGTSEGFAADILLNGVDLKQGLNNEIVVGGNLTTSNNEDITLFRFTEAPCIYPCEEATLISCGQTYTGSTSGFSNDFILTDYSCFGLNIQNPETRLYTGNDQLFVFEKEINGDLNISISSNNVDHDLFLFRECDQENLICYNAQSFSIDPIVGGINNESIHIPDAPIGVYYLIIDSPSPAEEGDFILSIDCCSDPVFDYDCGLISYNYTGNTLSYLFSANGIDNYATGVDWIIDNAPVAGIQQATPYTFPDNGTYSVCAPYYDENNCLNYCCETYCIRALPSCLEGLIPACMEGCACVEEEDSHLPLPFQCETFSTYNIGFVSAQSSFWTLEAGRADAIVSPINANNKALRILPFAEFNPFVLYNLYTGNNDNIECGRYRISWKMTVENGKNADFKLLYDKNQSDTADNVAIQVFFNEGNGTATIWDAYQFEASNINFSYQENTWINPMLIIDLDANQIEFWLDNRLVHLSSYDVSISGVFGDTVLGALAFSGNENTDFFVDDICVRAAQITNCPSEGDMVCVRNGASYDNACLAAQAGLYTGDELEICTSICDYPGEFIGRNDGQPYINSLVDYELAPNFLYTDPNFITVYNNLFAQAVPFPLYTDLYIFENEENGIIDIDFNSGDELAFVLVYQCICNEIDCSPLFIGERNDIDQTPLAAGFYYILVVNNGPANQYDIAVNPPSDCYINPPDMLSCGETVSGNFTTPNPTNTFQHNGTINNCYNGNRSYDGDGKIYRLEVEQASIIDIKFSTTGGAGGIFLFGSACAKTCLDYTETSIYGGTATMKNVTLASGFNYLAVFEETEMDSFTIEIICEDDLNNKTLLPLDIPIDCEQDFQNRHEIVIDFDQIKSNQADLVTPTSIFSIAAMAEQSEIAPEKIATGINLNYQQGTSNSFFIPTYNGNNNADRCALLEGDTMTLLISNEDGLKEAKAVFYPREESPLIDAEAIFTPGSRSQIRDYVITSLGFQVRTYPNTSFAFPSSASTQGQRVTVLVNDQQEWTVNTEQPWIHLIPEVTLQGVDQFIIKVDEWLGTEERTGQVVIQTVAFPFATKTINVKQFPPCVIPAISFPNAPNQTAKMCEGESITLTAETNSNNDNYNFYWDNETSPSNNSRTWESLAIGEHHFPLQIEQKSCPSSIVTTNLTIIVTEKPTTPSLNATSIGSCGGEDVFIITTPQEGVIYSWTDASGNEIAQGSSFAPTATGSFSVYGYYSQNMNCFSPSIDLNYTLTETFTAENTTTVDSICLGETIMLSVSTNVSTENLTFNWTNGITENANSVTYQPTEIGNQTVSVEIINTGNCPPITIDIPILVSTQPPLPEVEDVSYCNDQEAIALSVTNATDETIHWYASQNANVPIATGINFTPTDSGLFWVALENNNCTSERIAVQNTIGEAISLSLEATENQICLGDALTITANTSSNPDNYIWSDNVSGVGNQVTFIANNEGEQTINLSVSTGLCTTSSSINIEVGASNIPMPVIDNSALVICEGDAIPTLITSLNNEEDFTVYWYASPSGDDLLLSNNLSYSPSSLGTYYAETVDLSTSICTSETRLPISIEAVENIALNLTTSDSISCVGTAITLESNAQGGSAPENLQYLWNDDLGQQTRLNIESIAGVQAYTVTVTDTGSPCQNTASINIQGITFPTSEVISLECLSVTEYSTIINTNANTISTSSETIIVNNLGNGIYQFVAPSEVSFDITFSNTEGEISCPEATIPILAPNCECLEEIEQAIAVNTEIEICLGGTTATLEVLPPNDDNLIIEWYDNALLEGDPLTVGLTYQTSTAGLYYAIAAEPNTSCRSNSATIITLIVNDRPTADAGEDKIVCFGDTIQLDGLGSSGFAPLSYEWTPNTFLNEDNIATPLLEANGENIVLTLIVTDANGCSNFDQVNVQTTTLPQMDINEIQSIACNNGQTGQLEANNYTGSAPQAYIVWSTAATESSIDLLGAGIYSLTVTDENGCENHISYELLQPTAFNIIDSINEPIIIEGGELSNLGSLAMIISGATPPYTYEWFDENDESVSIDSIYHTDIPSRYQIVITDNNGCIFSYFFQLDVVVGLSELTDIGALKLFPNPTTKNISLEVNLFKNADIDLLLLDNLGQHLKSISYPNIQQDRFELTMENLPSGVYWLQVKIDGMTFNKKIIKID